MSARKSTDSARTGGRRSRVAEKDFSWDCADAGTNFSLAGFKKNHVLQIHDIGIVMGPIRDGRSGCNQKIKQADRKKHYGQNR
jgi:hypothetical protein